MAGDGSEIVGVESEEGSRIVGHPSEGNASEFLHVRLFREDCCMLAWCGGFGGKHGEEVLGAFATAVDVHAGGPELDEISSILINLAAG